MKVQRAKFHEHLELFADFFAVVILQQLFRFVAYFVDARHDMVDWLRVLAMQRQKELSAHNHLTSFSIQGKQFDHKSLLPRLGQRRTAENYVYVKEPGSNYRFAIATIGVGRGCRWGGEGGAGGDLDPSGFGNLIFFY